MAKSIYKRKEHTDAKNVTAKQNPQSKTTTTQKVTIKSNYNAKNVSEAQKRQEKTKDTSKITDGKSNISEATSPTETCTSTPRFEAKSRFNSKPKILYVADSVGH